VVLWCVCDLDTWLVRMTDVRHRSVPNDLSIYDFVRSYGTHSHTARRVEIRKRSVTTHTPTTGCSFLPLWVCRCRPLVFFLVFLLHTLLLPPRRSHGGMAEKEPSSYDIKAMPVPMRENGSIAPMSNPTFKGIPPYTGAWADCAYDPETPGPLYHPGK
jgi:hypothetical protein